MSAPHYQDQRERCLEDGLATYGDEKAALKAETSSTPSQPPTSDINSRCRIMNLRRITLTVGLGLLVGFGLVNANRSRPHQFHCSQEIHASNDEEIRALVQLTKDDTSALTEILRCASPETFHRLVNVYFPDQSNQESESSRAEVIGQDETWLVTAWEKLVKRQDGGAGNATPSGTATDNGAVIVTQTTTVTAPSDPIPSSTQSSSGPASTTSDPPPSSSTQARPTSSSLPPSSSTVQPPVSTTRQVPSSSSAPSQQTSSSQVQSSFQAPSTTSTSKQPESSTSKDVPPPSSSTSSSSSKPAPTTTMPRETTTSQAESNRPSGTTIHVSSSAVMETITSVRPDGGTTTITSTSWVAVDPPEKTGQSESDPSLQDAGVNLRASAAPALVVGGLITMLLMA